MPSDTATIRERILLHLDRFPGFDPSEIFNVPFDLTQDGIATVMGISRAHTSLELKKLKEQGKVDDWLAHVKGSGSKRKAYYLLPEGKIEADKLKIRFEESGIAVDTLLDMRRCDPAVMWDSLNAEDKDTFGFVCVFRVPIVKKDLPPTTSGVIPANFDGLVQISDSVREKYLKMADPEMIKIWNSRAADWWLDRNDEQERLHHLVNAGRHIEACKTLIKYADTFLQNPNEDLLATIKSIDVPPKYVESYYGIRAVVALECKDCDDAILCADKLDVFNTSEPELIRAEVLLISGDPNGAYEKSKKIFEDSNSARAALIVAKSLYSMKHYKELSSFVYKALKCFADNNDVTHIDKILVLSAGLQYEEGNPEDALSYLNKALTVCKNDMFRDRINYLADCVKSGKTGIRFF